MFVCGCHGGHTVNIHVSECECESECEWECVYGYVPLDVLESQSAAYFSLAPDDCLLSRLKFQTRAKKGCATPTVHRGKTRQSR